jgi:hypothetical protein
MLKIRIIMNSAVEDILSFKTCCSLRMFDQNLEIQVKNIGISDVVIPSYFDLQGEFGSHRVETLVPHGEQCIKPGEIVAFYCFMDEAVWAKARSLVFHDTSGNRYPVAVPG